MGLRVSRGSSSPSSFLRARYFRTFATQSQRSHTSVFQSRDGSRTCATSTGSRCRSGRNSPAVAGLELQAVQGDAPGMDGSGVVRPKPGFNCPYNGGLLYASNCPARIEIPDKGVCNGGTSD
jgi:hypothetical protein